MPPLKNDFPSLQAITPEPCENCGLRTACGKHKLACRAACEWAYAGRTKHPPGNPNPYWFAGLLAPDTKRYIAAKGLAIRLDRKIAKAAKAKAQRQALGDMARRVLG